MNKLIEQLVNMLEFVPKINETSLNGLSNSVISSNIGLNLAKIKVDS